MATVGHVVHIGDVIQDDGGPSIVNSVLYCSDNTEIDATELYTGGVQVANSVLVVSDTTFVADYYNYLGCLSVDDSPTEFAVASVGFFAVGGKLGAGLQPRYSAAVRRLMQKWGR